MQSKSADEYHDLQRLVQCDVKWMQLAALTVRGYRVGQLFAHAVNLISLTHFFHRVDLVGGYASPQFRSLVGTPGGDDASGNPNHLDKCQVA